MFYMNKRKTSDKEVNLMKNMNKTCFLKNMGQGDSREKENDSQLSMQNMRLKTKNKTLRLELCVFVFFTNSQT